jgi:hypothetical protein
MNAANAASNTRGSAYTVEYGWWDTPFSLVLNNARGVTKHAAAWKEGRSRRGVDAHPPTMTETPLPRGETWKEGGSTAANPTREPRQPPAPVWQQCGTVCNMACRLTMLIPRKTPQPLPSFLGRSLRHTMCRPRHRSGRHLRVRWQQYRMDAKMPLLP